MTHVFINKENPKKIKMIEAVDKTKAYIKLAERLRTEPNSGLASDYVFGYYF